MPSVLKDTFTQYLYEIFHSFIIKLNVGPSIVKTSMKPILRERWKELASLSIDLCLIIEFMYKQKSMLEP